MIQNWERHNLNTDFSRIQVPSGKPSDIDMFYVGDNYLVLGEIKNYEGTFSEFQRKMYQRFIDNCGFEHAIVIYINHDKKVEDRDTYVDVSMCFASEYYLKGYEGWHKPKEPMTVQMLFNWVEEKWK